MKKKPSKPRNKKSRIQRMMKQIDDDIATMRVVAMLNIPSGL